MSKTKPSGALTYNQCATSLRAQVGKDGFTQGQAEKILENLRHELEVKVAARGGNASDALRNVVKAKQDRHKANTLNEARLNANVAQKYRDGSTFTRQFPSQAEGLDALMNGSEKTKYAGSGAGIGGQARAAFEAQGGRLVADLDAVGVLREFRTGGHEEAALIELHELSVGGRVGISGDGVGQKIAKVLFAHYKELHGKLNRVGAFRTLDTSPVRAIHDRFKMLRPDPTVTTKEEAFQKWYDFVVPRMDVEKTFNPDVLSEELTDVKSFMRNLFLQMTHGTTGEGKFNPFIETQGIGGMAKKWSKHNPIYFRDGLAQSQYMKMYGVADLAHTVMHDMDKMTNAYVLMERLSADPPTVFNALLQDAHKQAAAEMDLAKSEALKKKLDRGALRQSFDQLMGKFDQPENISIHNVTVGMQAITSMAKLPKVMLSSMTDKALTYIGLRHGGVSPQRSLEAMFGLRIPADAEERRAIQSAGLFWDHLCSELVQGRYGVAHVRETTPIKIQQLFFKLTGINRWNSITKGAAGKAMLAELGENATKGFDALHPDTQKTLRHYAITPAEWDLMRSKARTIGSHTYIFPEDIRTVDTFFPEAMNQAHPLEAILRERGLELNQANVQEVLDTMDLKLTTFVHDQLDAMVVTPGNRERAQLSFGMRPGTYGSMVVKWAMMFKSFPLATWNRVVKREFYGHGSEGMKDFLLNDTRGKLHMVQLIATSTIAGYMVLATKDALEGKTPRRFFEEDGSFNWGTLADAMKQGGGGGLYADFLLTEYDRAYMTPLSAAAGPVFDLLQEPVLMGWDAARGKNISGETAKFIQDNTPFINLFYVKPVLDYLVLWNLREMVSPGVTRKYEKFIKNERHQDFWMRPSESLGL